MGLGLGSNPASAICPWRPLFPHLWRGVRPAAPRERWEARAELTSGRTEGSGQAWASERGISALRQPGRRGQGPAADRPLPLRGPRSLTCQGHSPLGHTLPPTIRPWGSLPFLFSRMGIFPHGYSTVEDKSLGRGFMPDLELMRGVL